MEDSLITQNDTVNEETSTQSMNYLDENEFRLPIGYTDSEGRLHSTIKLKPMTGETEEAISDPKIRDNGAKVVTELIYTVTERLGALPRVTKDVIRNLSIVDRDFIIAMSRVVSIGEEFSYLDKCSECGEKNEVSVNLMSLDVKYKEPNESLDITFDLIDGVIGDDGNICKRITITMPNGVVQERIVPITRVNPAQASTAMLHLITKKIEGVKYLNPVIFKKMTKRDRDFISKQLVENKWGIDLTVRAVCANCGEEFTSSIPLLAMLGE